MHDPGEESGDRANDDREQKRPVAQSRDRESNDDARERGHGLNGEVNSSQHDHEGDAGRQDEEHGGVARKLDQSARLEKARLGDPNQENEGGKRREREPLSEVIRTQRLRSHR